MSTADPRPVRIALTGAAGRMGRTITAAVAANPDFALSAAFERPGSAELGVDAGVLCGLGSLGVVLTADPGAADFDVLVDFSAPAATLAMLPLCVAEGRGLVIGTTGFDDDGLARIHEAAERIAVVMAPNMSVGVNLALRLIRLAAEALGDEADVEILETHHHHKVDAPSGTALRMGEVVAAALGRDLGEVAEHGRQGITGPRERSRIGFHSIRAGDVVGDHTVLFASIGERLEITHKASSRDNFAQGALRAARFCAEAPPGLYGMHDVLGFPPPLG